MMQARSTTIPDSAPVGSDSLPPLGPLAPGTVFGNRYRVLRHVASGGMGSVYEVLHLETQRRRALKVMHPHLFRSRDLRERFKREARIAAEIQSEHIVDVSDAGVDEATDTPFLVMELLHGEELGHRVERLGRLPFGEVVTVLTQVALALDKTHAKSIVHRDLKPENLFITHREDGTARVKILDFGLAKVVAEGSHAAGTTGRVGTPLYMAPEQLRSGSRLTKAADIYAMGMMAFTLLVGSPYWASEAESHDDLFVFAVALAAGPTEPAVARAKAKGVELPAAFDEWFARATALSVDQRFGSASEAASALSAALGVDAISGPALFGPVTPVSTPSISSGSDRLAVSATVPIGFSERLSSRGRRGRFIGAATFAVVVGALAILFATRPERRDHAAQPAASVTSVELPPLTTFADRSSSEKEMDPTRTVRPSETAAPNGTLGAETPSLPPVSTAGILPGPVPSPSQGRTSERPSSAAASTPSGKPASTPSGKPASKAPAATPTSLFGRDD